MKSGLFNTSWAKELETGIGVLDAQHKQYFHLLNNYLEKAAVPTSTPEKILDLAETFNFLRQYAREHFSTEELLMTKTEYSGYQSHQAQHEYFLQRVESLYEQMRKVGFSPDLAREVNYYTIEWFTDHIRDIDVKLADFLKKKATEDRGILNLIEN